MFFPDLLLSCIWVRVLRIATSTRRLRQKIHLPYQSLAQHVSRLEQLQQATDILRRISRFVIVARRLEFQMSEIQRLEKNAKTPNSVSSSDIRSDAIASTNGTDAKATSNVTAGALQAQDSEKERTIAKAALSIAELGMVL